MPRIRGRDRPSSWRALLALILVVVTACDFGGRPQPDDRAFEQAVEQGRAGAEVTFDGTLIDRPVRIGSHEHLELRAPSDVLVEVDHNAELAPWVPAQPGDRVVVHGQLYIDQGRVGVHCTHAKTSRGCPQPGWIEWRGRYYE